MTWFWEKRKFEQQRLEARQQKLDESIEKNNQLQEETVNVQKGELEVARKNHELNQQLIGLVAENEKRKNTLLEQEQKLALQKTELEERQHQIRKDEILLTAQKANIRKEEAAIEAREKTLEWEQDRVRNETQSAKDLKQKADEVQEKYQTLFTSLKMSEDAIKNQEEAAIRKNKDADLKLRKADEISLKASSFEEEMKSKEATFEARREEIEVALKEKINEYDRRIMDLDNAKELLDGINYDDTENGKTAKLVVKEAIRQAKKTLGDVKTRFDELDEKYSSGTFKGFSTPLELIDNEFENLRAQYSQITEHIKSNPNLPSSVHKWLSTIEDQIIGADTHKKAWEFSEAYRCILYGVATCKNYELLIQILNDYASTENPEQADADTFVNWYDVLDVKNTDTCADIKKQFRKLAKKYHPDTAPDGKEEEYKEKMANINKAWDILGDEDKRREFDDELKRRS